MPKFIFYLLIIVIVSCYYFISLVNINYFMDYYHFLWLIETWFGIVWLQVNFVYCHLIQKILLLASLFLKFRLSQYHYKKRSTISFFFLLCVFILYALRILLRIFWHLSCFLRGKSTFFSWNFLHPSSV